jgi:hypothetical protein
MRLSLPFDWAARCVVCLAALLHRSDVLKYSRHHQGRQPEYSSTNIHYSDYNSKLQPKSISEPATAASGNGEAEVMRPP